MQQQEKQLEKLTEMSRSKLAQAKKYKNDADREKDLHKKKLYLDNAAALLKDARELAELARTFKS